LILEHHQNSLKTTSFGLNSGGLSPTMNAAVATLFWSQFGRPQPDDEISSKPFLAQFGRRPKGALIVDSLGGL
jgi:hypothetical protein